MPTQPIPFTGSSKNSDVQFQNGINYTCRNGVVDELGNLSGRPGSSVFVDLGTSLPVTGLFYSSKQNVTVAVSGQQIFTITAAGVATDITGTGIPELAALVTFADFGDTVYCANGGKIIKVPLTGATTTYVTDAGAPTLVTHVAVLNQKLIANNKAYSARFQWSAVGLPEDWSDGYFATAEAQEDDLLFLGVADERVVLGGENTFEFWRDTGVIASAFVPESQEFTQRGTITKHSPAFCRDRWILIDEYKQLVMLNGRQAIPIPTQNPRGLTNFLQGLDLTDARGRFVVSAGKFYYLCQLPKAEKSFFYDIDKEEWLEASDWDEINAEDDLYRAYATTYAFGPNWGQMLIGDSRAGNVYCFDDSAYTDSTETIRTVLETGYIDRGTSDNRKKTSRLSGRLKVSNESKTSDGLGTELWDKSAIVVDSPIVDNGDGTYTVDGSQVAQVDIYNLNTVTFTASYRTSFEVISVSAGSAATKAGGVLSTLRTTAGVYAEDVTAGTGTKTGIVMSVNFAGTVKMISIRENTKIINPSLNMVFQWRNENTHVWSERLIKLYKESNNQFRWATSGLGSYYMRQYRFIVTADTDFIMSPPQETFEYVK